MDDAAADRKCEYVALLSSGSIVIGSHCLLPFGNETPSVGIAFPRPFARLWCDRLGAGQRARLHSFTRPEYGILYLWALKKETK
jgi:hypothetical protein